MVEQGAERLWEDALRPMARELIANAPALSTDVVTVIREQFPELFLTDGGFEENRRATEANLIEAATVIEAGRDPASFELPAPTAEYAYDAVHRGVPLASLHRSIRLGHAALWRWCDTWLRAHVTDHADLLAAYGLASSWLFAIVDALSNATESAYTVERERWLRTAAAVRSETIAGILTGQEADSQAAGRRLRYELNREHIALIAWVDSDEDGKDTFATLETAVEAAARATGAAGSISQPLGLLATEAWLSFPVPPEADRLDGIRLELSGTPNVYLASGEAAPGIAGFRVSHEQALLARRVATLTERRPASFTRYSRVALQAMVSTDLVQARAFVHRELGSLADSDDTSLRLAGTLQIYLSEHTSRSRAAKRLGVHENTISYRIRQVEDILGRGLGEDTLNLRVALAIAPIVRGEESAVPEAAPGRTR